jgi:AcrR family transcriptional regulator
MDVREALLEAAIKVYAEAGMRGATTRRIAQAADVNEVTLFRHFRTKRDLLRAALEHFTLSGVAQPLPDGPRSPLGAHRLVPRRIRELLCRPSSGKP